MDTYLLRILTDYQKLIDPTDIAGPPEEVARVEYGITRAQILGDVTLSPPVVTPSTDKDQIYSQQYTNNTSVEQSQTLKFTKTLTRTVTTTKTKSFEVGTEISFEAGLEGLGKMSGKVTVKAGKNTTNTETNSVSEMWGIDNPIKVPPRSTVEAVVYVQEGEISVDYECQARIYEGKCETPQIKLQEDQDVGFRLARLLAKYPDRRAYYGADLGNASTPDSPRYRLNGEQLVGRAKGTFTAKAGVSVHTIVNQLDPNKGRVLSSSAQLPFEVGPFPEKTPLAMAQAALSEHRHSSS
ncbi:ETX/MTX2 family pore-forming toxin [Actinomadura chibensis]|nr:ETX/MTX2 family pore-forming toxin [Actinomadura chibensis]